MQVDMTKCFEGQKLVSASGMILTYLGKSGQSDYPHKIQYFDGSEGTRLDNGQVFSHPQDGDENVIFCFATDDQFNAAVKILRNAVKRTAKSYPVLTAPFTVKDYELMDSFGIDYILAKNMLKGFGRICQGLPL